MVQAAAAVVPVAAVQAAVRPAAEQAAGWAQAGVPVAQAVAVVRAAVLAAVLAVPVKRAVPAGCAAVPGKPEAGCAVVPVVVPLVQVSPARLVGPAVVGNAVVPAEAARMARVVVAKMVARPSAAAIATVGVIAGTAGIATDGWIATAGVTAVVVVAEATVGPHAALSGASVRLSAPNSGRTCSAAPCRGSPPAHLP